MMQKNHSTTIPTQLNLWLVSAIILLNIWQMLVMPIYIMPLLNVWQITCLLLLYLAFTPLHWALLHEAIHSHLHPNKPINDMLGRMLAIILFASFYLLQFGHLMHHRFNRRLGHEYYHSRESSVIRMNLRYYYQLLIGLYLFEVIASLLVACLPRPWLIRYYHAKCTDAEGKPLPELEQAGHHYFFRRHRMRHVRIDVITGVLVFTALWFAAAEYVFYLATLLLGRGFIISFHDNVYHYGTPADNSKAAKELYLSPLLAKAMLHFNYHHTHHCYPQLPWQSLPVKHQQIAMEYDQPFSSALMEQCKGMQPHIAV